MNNTLDLFDQTFASLDRATGVLGLLQCVWVYDREIDLDGLRRFHRNLLRGRLSRRVERSALPFGRDRWVSTSGRSRLEIVTTPRPRHEFDGWLREQAATPLDVERGPEWHLAVLPFTDGGAGVSLVIPHALTDGIGLCDALADAASGRPDPVSWPAAASRRRWRSLREDARQAARDIPEIGRALASAARQARAGVATAGPSTPPPAAPSQSITLPTETVFVDADEWDARAAALGGTSNTLLAGLAARLAHRAGRVTPDGRVTLAIPVNERTLGDTRANAVADADVTVDPAPAATDLRDIRASTKQALIRLQDTPDRRRELLPLVPLMPQWLIRRLVGVAAGSPTAVVASNLGDLNPGVCRPDGTDADHFAIRAPHPDTTTAVMDRFGGMLSLASGRANGQVFVSVVAYQPGRPDSNEVLRSDLSGALRDFSLDATLGFATHCVETALSAPQRGSTTL
ncbi:hypothetical protein [Mycobacterium sp. 1245805.9]|uniref:hypothetical protein n=1 Tax=Mycobacterium sp. 1245805.9 TaxID=1856862 RepID=UPI000800B526|nr:hypothetical protein [Mycobacterium sp. 1245805.9]OBI94252.1 hypothetical protein A9X00_12995 [Mycobacterium sp. 1245805.9]